MSSISDMLTAAKNVVSAINQLGQTYLSAVGVSLYSNITTATVVKSSQGRICRISVVEAGSAAGAIYDASLAGATTNKVWTIPTTAGITEINLPVNNGIVVAPGTGQTIAISYS